jgi:hypothetical protein
MTIKNKIVLEVIRGERTYEMVLSPDSPLGEAFDAITEMRNYLVERINQVEKENQAPQG